MRSSLAFFFVLVAAGCFSAAAGSPAGADPVPRRGLIPGGWSPIENVNDAHIQELGRWAVSAHDKQTGDGLVFGRVVSGQSQVVAGTNYRLVIEATNGSGKKASYEAVVWEQPWTNTTKLTSFKPAK